MESLWPIIVLWIVFSLLGARKKRQQSTLPPGPTPADATRQVQGGFMEEMQRALEEMKRAAAEQGGQRPKSAGQQETAARYLEQRKMAAAGRRRQSAVFLPGEGRRKPVVRPQRPLEDDDAEKSSEDEGVVSLEGSDYDRGADQIAAERAQAADRGARMVGEAEVMSAAQLARRAQRTPVPLGTASEHAAWHKAIGSPAAAAVVAQRPGRLGRWADGSLRGAVVLAEILGRPGGTR